MRRGLLAPERGLGVVAEEKAPRLGGREMRLLMPYLRPYLPAALAAIALMVASTGLKLAGPLFLRTAIDRGIIEANVSYINLFGALFVLSAIGGFASLRYATSTAGVVGEKVLRDLRVAAFRHLNSLSLGFFERERSGRLVARITSDIEAVERLVTESLVQIVTQTLFLVGAAVVIFATEWRLALVAMSVTPLMFVATLIFRRYSRRVYGEVRERVASVLSYLQETLRGVHVVQAFSRERSRARVFRTVNEEWADASTSAFVLEAYYFPVMEFLGWVGTGLVVVIGGGRALSGDLTPGTLALFLVYLNTFFDPIHHMSELYMNVQQAKAGLARVAKLLDTQPEIRDRPEAQTLPSLAGSVAFREVTFSYRPGTAPALEKVSFQVDPGETIALVGATGAGKSTVVKLIARFYEATEGELLLDGINIAALSEQTLRSQIALVPQEGFLFGGSIRENIRFGRPGATDEEIEEVCARCGIDEFLASLPEGYETEVRERGARLSAGERQLIALARALVSQPAVILLDEATSSLDSATEVRVEKAFRSAVSGRTCVIIAHRLSTAMRADRILVLERGRLVESGTHDDLIEVGGRYKDLYQFWLARPEAFTGDGKGY
ncbi:MAG: ABC transporter ATP-binding protein [Actinomycetota bacterium]